MLGGAFNMYPAEELKKMEETFMRIDLDGSGSIDPTELRILMVELGKPSDDAAIQTMLAELDEDGDGDISLDEFRSWWLKSEGYNGSLADGLNAMRNLTAQPVLIFYHLFDEDSEWFTRLGPRGVPLRYTSDAITMTMNVFILLSTFASTMETMAIYSPDPHRNPEHFEAWKFIWGIIGISCTAMFSIEWIMKAVGALAANEVRLSDLPLRADTDP